MEYNRYAELYGKMALRFWAIIDKKNNFQKQTNIGKKLCVFAGEMYLTVEGPVMASLFCNVYFNEGNYANHTWTWFCGYPVPRESTAAGITAVL